jgi:hypothetical protein
MCAVVNGAFPGTPFPYTWFLAGDQLDFSDDINASSRPYSEVEIGSVDRDPRVITSEVHRCRQSKTLEADGNLIETGTAPTDDPHFINLRDNQSIDPGDGVIDDIDNLNVVQIDVSGSGRVAFSVAASVPAIDYVGTLSFDPDSHVARFRGGVDAFPSYEMYVSVHGGPATQSYAFPATDPLAIVGGTPPTMSTSASRSPRRGLMTAAG